MTVSPAKQRVLDAIRDIGADGWPVTIRDIARATGTASPSTVYWHLVDLEHAGLVERNPRGRVGYRLKAAP